MTKTGTGSHTDEQGARPVEEAQSHSSALLLRSIAELARQLNGATTAPQAYRIALDSLAHFIIAERLSATTGSLDERQRLCAQLETGGKFSFFEDGEVVRLRHTMLAGAAESGAPVYFNDVPSELVGGSLILSLVCTGAQSILCAPLMLDRKLTGMVIVSTTRPDAYNEKDAETAALVCHLLAATLLRIELYERAAGARRHDQARLHEQSLIDRLGAAARSMTDLDHIIQHTVDALARALPASFIILRRVSFGQPEPVMHAWTLGHDRPPLEIQAPVSKAERTVYSEQRAVFISDAREERVADLRPLIERLGARSIYLLPLVYGGQVLAALGLIESDAQRRWTDDEQSVLARIAETIAPLIFNAQLHTRLRSVVADLLTLLRLTSEVEGESDLDRCLRAVLDSWLNISGADAVALLRWDEEAESLRLAASKHLPTAILERYTQGVTLNDPVFGLAASRRAGVVADLTSEMRGSDMHSAVRWSNLRGAWATPVTGQAGKLLGILVAFSRVATEVSADEQRLADLFTRPVAIAMENLERSRAARARTQTQQQLEEKLRQADRHKTEFMSVISHELRTPLNAIIGYAQMLKDGFSGELNEPQRVDVQTIIDSADRLLSMVEDTLDLVRIDAERFPVFMDNVGYEEIIKRAIGSVRSTAEMKGLDINLDISDDAPVVRTDPERVRQILTNLLSNAVKFTDSGSIRIAVDRADAGGVEISVTDTGIGFDTTAFPHIFEEFRQVDASNTRIYGGSGLGLAVSKRLVQRLGGNIGVHSAPGEGSTFWFRLPPEIPGADV
jgi:signal transduction histidine kinase/putative methionine-R-sulfoxide reductase with GAF domain